MASGSFRSFDKILVGTGYGAQPFLVDVSTFAKAQPDKYCGRK